MLAELMLLGMVCSFVAILLTSAPATDEKVWDRDRTLGFGRGTRRRLTTLDVSTVLTCPIGFQPAALRESANPTAVRPSMDLIAFLNGTPAASRATPEFLDA